MGSSACSSSKSADKDKLKKQNSQYQEGQQPDQFTEEQAKQGAMDLEEQYMNTLKKSPSMRKQNTLIGLDSQQKYKSVMVIHSSPNGDILQGINLLTNDPVAIKSVKLIGSESQVKKDKAKIIKYVQNLKTLNHPNVIRYLDIVEENLGIQVIFELLNNGSLKTYISEKSTISEEETAMFARQILEGLRYIHQSQLLHRNLKAANVMLLSDEEQIKLSNLEINSSAVMLKKNQSSITDPDGISQNPDNLPNWMAPETITKGIYSFKSDIWSFGCILIELLTGMAPYPGLAPIKVREWLSYGVRPQFPVKFTQQCEEILESCFQIDPEKRLSIDELLTLPFLQDSNQSNFYNNSNQKQAQPENQKNQKQYQQQPNDSIRNQQPQKPQSSQMDNLSQFSEPISNQNDKQEVDMKMRWKKNPNGDYIIHTVGTIRPDYAKNYPQNNNNNLNDFSRNNDAVFHSNNSIANNPSSDMKNKPIKSYNATPQAQSKSNLDKKPSVQSIASQCQSQPNESYPEIHDSRQRAPKEYEERRQQRSQQSNSSSCKSLGNQTGEDPQQQYYQSNQNNQGQQDYYQPSQDQPFQSSSKEHINQADKQTQYPENAPTTEKKSKSQTTIKKERRISSSPQLKQLSKKSESPKKQSQQSPKKANRKTSPTKTTKEQPSKMKTKKKETGNESTSPAKKAASNKNIPQEEKQQLVSQKSLNSSPQQQYDLTNSEYPNSSRNPTHNRDQNNDSHQPKSQQYILYKRKISIPDFKKQEQKLIEELHKAQQPNVNQWIPLDSSTQFKLTQETEAESNDRSQEDLGSRNYFQSQPYRQDSISEAKINKIPDYEPYRNNSASRINGNQEQSYPQTNQNPQKKLAAKQRSLKQTPSPCGEDSYNKNTNNGQYNRLPQYSKDPPSKRDIPPAAPKKEKAVSMTQSEFMAMEKERRYEEWQQALQRELLLQEQQQQQQQRK